MSTKLKSWLLQEQQLSQSQRNMQRHMWRWVLATSLSFILAMTVEWSLAFVTPVFVAKFLLPGKPGLSLALIRKLSLLVLFCFSLGLVLVSVAIPYPAMLLLVLSWSLLLVFYHGNRGLNELVVLFTLIALIALPMLATIDRAIAFGFVSGFMYSMVLAMLIVALFQWLMPVVEDFKPVEPAAKPEPLEHKPALQRALVSTAIILPLVIYFFAFDKVTDLLVVIFVAILAQNPDLDKGFKASAAIVLSNFLCGLGAVIAFNLLVAVPELYFMIPLSFACFMLIARLIYLSKLGPLVEAGMSAFVIVLGGTIGSAGGIASDKFWIRITQLLVVGLYIVASFYLAKKSADERAARKKLQKI